VTTAAREPEPVDDDEIAQIVRGFVAQQARLAADQKRPLCRGTHAKGLCVRAVFQVPDLAAGPNPELARRLAIGLFARPGSYPAVVRFANSDPTINSDWMPDVRGLSFSLDLSAGAAPVTTPGARHDWSFQSAPTLPFDNVRAFAVFGTVLAARSRAAALASLNHHDRTVYVRTRAAVKQQQRDQRVRPYQQLRYWSNVPFRHGADDVVKYSASPLAANLARPLEVGNPRALQHELVRHVTDDETMSAFDIAVQFLDVERMRLRLERRDAEFWIEHASVEWPEKEAPFHTVARLTLVRGGMLPADACERMFIDVNEFSLPAHAPLGRINRARHFAERASRHARGVV